MSTPPSQAEPEVPFAPFDGVRESLDRPGVIVIDLRAPSEFAADHLPGAVNVPLFQDLTRSFVGLLYKQFSPEAAFQEGRAAVVERVDGLVQEIAAHAGWTVPPADLRARVIAMTSGGIAKMEAELTPVPVQSLPEGAVVLNCARGGLRSRSVVALLRFLGLERAIGLEGGYRAYRRSVMAELDAWTPPPLVISLRGLTGVGKTLVLREIERLRPGWTLDLEGHAGHRSSLLGMVGLEPVGQKSFESQLAERARRGFPGGVMVVEGESRKVGDVTIPGPIWGSMRRATNIEITASIPRRIAVLSEDYLGDESALPLLRDQLAAVADRMEGRPELPEMLDRREIAPLVQILLERYYDPLYQRSEQGKSYVASIDAEDETVAAERVISAIDFRRFSYGTVLRK